MKNLNVNTEELAARAALTCELPAGEHKLAGKPAQLPACCAAHRAEPTCDPSSSGLLATPTPPSCSEKQQKCWCFSDLLAGWIPVVSGDRGMGGHSGRAEGGEVTHRFALLIHSVTEVHFTVQVDQVVVPGKTEHLDRKSALRGLPVLHHLDRGVLGTWTSARVTADNPVG